MASGCLYVRCINRVNGQGSVNLRICRAMEVNDRVTMVIRDEIGEKHITNIRLGLYNLLKTQGKALTSCAVIELNNSEPGLAVKARIGLDFGTYALIWNNEPYGVSVIRCDVKKHPNLGTYKPLCEEVTITGTSNDAVKALIREAVRLSHKNDKIATYYHGAKCYGWSGPEYQPKRRLDTVILHDNVRDVIVKDIEWFLKSKDLYSRYGTPWKRNYLFSGPPGAGKSSLVQALAGHFDFTLSAMTLSDHTDSDVSNAMSTLPKKTILLFEDADSIFGEKTDQVSLSTILNILDGSKSRHGMIIIMTTNHPEKFPAVVKRPGRVDMHVQFTVPTHDMIRRILTQTGHDNDASQTLVESIKNTGASMAAIQGWLLRNHDCDDLADKVSDLENIVRGSKESNASGQMFM